MPQVHQQKVLPYAPVVLYDLVRDVRSYPDFLPWCGGAILHEQSDTMQQATLVIAKGLLRHKFTTHNVCVPHQSIKMYLVSGPLRHLTGSWRFEPDGQGTCVTLTLDFDFDIPVFSGAMNGFFQRATSRMVSAFEQRAREVCCDPS